MYPSHLINEFRSVLGRYVSGKTANDQTGWPKVGQQINDSGSKKRSNSKADRLREWLGFLLFNKLLSRLPFFKRLFAHVGPPFSIGSIR
jgi:hypothetical protein